MIIVNLEEVVEVATHFLGGQQERCEFVAVIVRIFVAFFAGQHRKLNVSGKVEFALDTLHVLLLFDVFLDFGEHVRERPREFGHFVMTRDFRNRHVKVSAPELAGRNGQVLERLCHAERNQQDNYEYYAVSAESHHQEQPAHGALVFEVFLDRPHDHECPVGRMDRGVVNGRFFAACNRTDKQPAAIAAFAVKID